MRDWEKIYESSDSFRVNMLANTLESHDIKAIVVNKKDSAYNNFGNCELHVAREQVILALNILKHEFETE